MKRSFASAASIVILALAGLVAARNIARTSGFVDDEKEDAKAEYQRPQSSPLPAPKGLTFIDQGVHDKRLTGYRTPAGFRLEIVAEQPLVTNPVGMAFAEDGTPFVLERLASPEGKISEYVETVKYKDGSTRRFAAWRKTKKDVVKMLSSSKGDGIFDRAKVVLEDDSLAGILIHDGWLYLAGRGTVKRYSQSKPGGSFDVHEIVAKGFGGFHANQVSGMTIGNDGWLYVTAGAGDHYVEGSDGSRATVLRTGAIFRCQPDGGKLSTFAIGFCNPRGDPAFDLGGNLFHIDKDVPDKGKFAGCRLMHVADQADLGWRLAFDSKTLPDQVRGAVFGELPGKMPPMLKTGKGEANGLFIYNDSRLPEDYRGLLFYPDAARRIIQAYKTESSGASFKAVEEFTFFDAEKDDSFHPCKMLIGPDGAIYIVNRHGGSTAHGKEGRIYRLTWSGTKVRPASASRGLDSWAKIAKLEDNELIKALSSEEASDREMARRELVKRGDKHRPALVKLLADSDTALVAKIAALGALQSMYDASVQTAFENSLEDGEAELARLAAEALGLLAKKADRDVYAALLQALSSEDLSVRRAVALAMGRLAFPGASDNLAVALSFDESNDPFLRDGILRGLEMLGKPGIDALIALADSGVQKDTDRVVEAFLALRSKWAFDALPTLLKHMHVGSGQRADLIRSAGNYLFESQASFDAIVAYVASQAKETAEVKLALLDLLSTPGIVTGPKARDLVVTMLQDPATKSKAFFVLGLEPESACIVGKLYLEKKLPGVTREEVARALRKHATKDRNAAKLLEIVGKAD